MYAPCQQCQVTFESCCKGENCCNPSGPLQAISAFHKNGDRLRTTCKLCEKKVKNR